MSGFYASLMRPRNEHPRQDPDHRSGQRGGRRPSGWWSSAPPLRSWPGPRAREFRVTVHRPPRMPSPKPANALAAG